jgi:hypothetical protein
MSVLSRKTGFFHLFISYQVASDSELAEALYNKLLSLSNQISTKVPCSESFYWPSEFLRSDPSSLRIFFDKKCLAPGRPWDWAGSINSGGFLGALNKSIVMLPVVSMGIGTDGVLTGSLGRLLRFGHTVSKIAQGMPTSSFTVGGKFWFSSNVPIPRLLLFAPYVVTKIENLDIYAEVDSPLASQRKLICCKPDAIQTMSDDGLSVVSELRIASLDGVCVYVSCDNESTLPVDNVLFEWIFAVALNRLKGKGANGPLFKPCQSIFPIFSGGIHGDRPIASLYKVKGLLSNECPSKTFQKVLDIFSDLGLTCPLAADSVNLNAFFSDFLRFQGSEYSPDSVDSLCTSVFSAISIALTDDVAAFVSNKPMAAELRDFLATHQAKYLLPALASHNVSCVKDLCYFEPQSYSMTCFVKEASAVCRRTPLDLSLHLSKIVDAAKASNMSLPLNVRLRMFRDPHVAWFTAATSAAGLDLVLCKPFFLLVCLLVALGSLTAGLISYGTFGWSQNALTLLVLAAGGIATSASSYFVHPSFGRHCLVVMFSMLAPSSVFAWYLDRQAGYSTCAQAQTQNNLLSSFDTCASFMSFPILTVQLILYAGNAFNAKFAQHLFWYFVAVVCAILNACYLYLDVNIRESSLFAKLLDVLFMSFCIFLFLFIKIRRITSRNKAIALTSPDAVALNSLWSQVDSFEKVDTDGVFDAFEHLQCVIDLPHRAVPNLHQDCDDIQELFSRGQFLNVSFQDWIESWFDSTVSDQQFFNPESPYADHFKLNLAALAGSVTVMRGPIKLPSRAIAKVYRSYNSDSSRLTDIVRCSVVCTNIAAITEIAAQVCLSGAAPSGIRSSVLKHVLIFCSGSRSGNILNVAPSEPPCGFMFEICRIRNRFHRSWNPLDGYRDLSFKLKLGYEESLSGGCWFVPVKEWALKKGSMKTLICELQLQLQYPTLDRSSLASMHSRYVERRNLLSQ